MKKTAFSLIVFLIGVILIGSVCYAQDSIQTSHFHTGMNPAQKPVAQTEYKFTPLYDESTGYTLARACTPADHTVEHLFYSALSAEGECSIACPYQVVIHSSDPDGSTHMIYRSEMNYIYPPDPEQYFQEGVRYGTNMQTFIGYPMEMMLYPRTALELADTMAAGLVQENADIQRIETAYMTQEDDPYLAAQAKEKKDYLNSGVIPNPLFNVGCDLVTASWADVTYMVSDPVQSSVIRVVLSTNIAHFTAADLTTNASIAYAETTVPYVYICITTPEESERAFADFELFVSNSRVTDEFVIMNRMESLMLQEIIQQGWSSINEDELLASLGTADGSFYEDMFSDYLLDRNEYMDSNGRSFKVPTSFDYVYENADGEIVVTDSADPPAGSTRLYAK